MLIRFCVSNYRSLKEEQELSFVATKIEGNEEGLVRPTSLSVELLKVLALYGANASGKSNVFKALQFFREVIITSGRNESESGMEIPTVPFLLDKSMANKPSKFEADLLIDGVRYTYGFACTRQRFTKEYLFSYPKGRKRVLFRRDAEEFEFSKLLGGRNKTIQELTKPNNLFLSRAEQFSHEQLTPISKWIRTRLRFVDPNIRDSLLSAAAKVCETGVNESLVRLLKAADLGIVGLSVEKEKLDPRFSKAIQAFLTAMDSGESKEALKAHEALEGRTKIMMRHRGANSHEAAFPIEEESEGTRAYFGLVHAIASTISSGGILCVDELDASLHPLLALQLIQWFNSKAIQNAQLLFNTHDTTLLDEDFIRRDQLWFAEKDDTGSTHIYPLTDFHPRKSESLRRGYLQGRYGAIPFLGKLRSELDETH